MMDKNKQMMAIIAVVAIVIVVIVAVLLMQPSAGPAPGGAPSGTQPGTGPGGTTPPAGGTTPPAGGTTPPAGGGTGMETLADAIAAGSPVICEITINEVPMKLWMEAPKIRAEVDYEAEGMPISMIVISDGTDSYMQMSMFGDDWYKAPQDEEQPTVPTAQEIKESLESLPDIETSCQRVADIPDSQFQLPAGVVAKDMSELMAGFDASAYE
ncbi:MAG: hypothetical protein JXB14_04305 [Candidatus Altiarchaeota archaeon]|nr:hypothetical protein [Candidatus Altiarchaeota archaeon]